MSLKHNLQVATREVDKARQQLDSLQGTCDALKDEITNAREEARAARAEARLRREDAAQWREQTEERGRALSMAQAQIVALEAERTEIMECLEGVQQQADEAAARQRATELKVSPQCPACPHEW